MRRHIEYVLVEEVPPRLTTILFDAFQLRWKTLLTLRFSGSTFDDLDVYGRDEVGPVLAREFSALYRLSVRPVEHAVYDEPRAFSNQVLGGDPYQRRFARVRGNPFQFLFGRVEKLFEGFADVGG
jgi:hypothetical protein